MAEILRTMKKLSQMLTGILNEGIPGHTPIYASTWAKKFAKNADGKQVVSESLLFGVIRQDRTPTIETLVLLGVLFQRCGADIGIFDLVGAACDGIYPKVMRDLGYGEVEELAEWSLGNPEEAELGVPSSAAIDAYMALSFKDRQAIAPELLGKIRRDMELAGLGSEFEVVQRLVREAVNVRNIGRLADEVRVERSWIEAILKGDAAAVRAAANPGMLMRLAKIVPNLDNQKGHPESFACLLKESRVSKFLEQVETEKERKKTGKVVRLAG